jgi:pyrroline-5-carboxylate reductase
MGQSASQALSPSHPGADLGFIGVGALSTALARALMRAWPHLRLHLSPRGEAASTQLATLNGVLRHPSNQSVADASNMLVIGVRPGQLPALAAELRLQPRHHLLCLSAGTPLATLQGLFAPARITRLMTGLAVAGARSAISVFPPAADVSTLLAPACVSVVGLDTEARFDASILAVCANAWWLDQLADMSDWMVRATGMAPDQAQALLCANMADVATMLQLDPGRDARELARAIGTPGTYTALGLDQLQQRQAHRAWEDALTSVLARLQAPGPPTDPSILKDP